MHLYNQGATGPCQQHPVVQRTAQLLFASPLGRMAQLDSTLCCRRRLQGQWHCAHALHSCPLNSSPCMRQGPRGTVHSCRIGCLMHSSSPVHKGLSQALADPIPLLWPCSASGAIQSSRVNNQERCCNQQKCSLSGLYQTAEALQKLTQNRAWPLGPDARLAGTGAAATVFIGCVDWRGASLVALIITHHS